MPKVYLSKFTIQNKEDLEDIKKLYPWANKIVETEQGYFFLQDGKDNEQENE